jgi:hypothetical protein
LGQLVDAAQGEFEFEASCSLCRPIAALPMIVPSERLPKVI